MNASVNIVDLGLANGLALTRWLAIALIRGAMLCFIIFCNAVILVQYIAEPAFPGDIQHKPDQYHICCCTETLCGRAPVNMI